MAKERLTREQYGDAWIRWDPKIKIACDENGLPCSLMKAILMNESTLGLDPRVKRGLEDPEDIEGSRSEDGLSWGLAQMEVKTARDYDLIATPVKLNNPDYSITLAAKHLGRLYRIFKGEEEWVVKAYNEGEGHAILEKSGKLLGSANGYWLRYQEHKELITANP